MKGRRIWSVITAILMFFAAVPAVSMPVHAADAVSGVVNANSVTASNLVLDGDTTMIMDADLVLSSISGPYDLDIEAVKGDPHTLTVNSTEGPALSVAKLTIGADVVLYAYDSCAAEAESIAVTGGSLLAQGNPAIYASGGSITAASGFGVASPEQFYIQGGMIMDSTTGLEAQTVMIAPVPVEYTVSFETGKGPKVGAVTAEEGAWIEAPAVSTWNDCDFGGWYPEGKYQDSDRIVFPYQVTGDVTFYAKWTANLAVYAGEGGRISDGEGWTSEISGRYYAGTGVSLSAEAEENYDFRYWADADGNKVSSSNPYSFNVDRHTALTAVFEKQPEPVEYTVSFDTGKGPKVDPVTAEEGASISAPEVPVWENHDFEGWYPKGTFVDEDKVSFPYEVTGDVTFHALWTANLNVGVADTEGNAGKGGKVSSGEDVWTTSISERYMAGVEASLKAEAAEEYDFIRWEDKDGNEVSTKNPYSFAVNEHTALTAVFEKQPEPEKFTVTFETGKGSKIEAVTVEAGTKIKAPEDPEWENRDFGGWYPDEKYLEEKAIVFPYEVKEDVTFYALWTVKFEAGVADTESKSGEGGRISAGDDEWVTKISETYPAGTEASLSAEPAEGYDFIRWEDKDGKEVSTKNPYSFTVNEHTALTAVFEKQPEPEKFTVTFETGKGSQVGEVTVEAGTEIEAPEEPKWENRDFGGWYPDDKYSDEDKIQFPFRVLEDAVFHAKWTAKLTVGVADDKGTEGSGGKISAVEDTSKTRFSGSYIAGEEVTISAEAVEGYRFIRWEDGDGKEVSTSNPYKINVNEHTTLTAVFEKKTAMAASAPAHTHVLDRVNRKDATCEEDGNTGYWYCEDCERYFADSEAAKEIEKEDTVIPATGHDWGSWRVTRRATETSSGVRERVCRNDPSHVQKEVIPATGQAQQTQAPPHTHDYDWEITVEPTSTVDGEMVYICKGCGRITQRIPVSGYPVFQRETRDRIHNAFPNTTVVVYTDRWISFHRMVLDEFTRRGDVTLAVYYYYRGHRYLMVIPAGTNASAFANQEGYAGFLFLSGKVGRAEVY